MGPPTATPKTRKVSTYATLFARISANARLAWEKIMPSLPNDLHPIDCLWPNIKLQAADYECALVFEGSLYGIRYRGEGKFHELDLEKIDGFFWKDPFDSLNEYIALLCQQAKNSVLEPKP